MLRFLFSIIVIAGVLGDPCPNNGYLWRNDCYVFNALSFAFASAEGSCNQLGGTLASIHDSFTNAYIAQQGALYFSNSSTDFWIGATTLMSPQAWAWTDASKFDFDELWDHRPTNSSLCIGLKADDGTWLINNCYQTKQFVCRIPGTPPPCNNNQ